MNYKVLTKCYINCNTIFFVSHNIGHSVAKNKINLSEYLAWWIVWHKNGCTLKITTILFQLLEYT